MLRKDRAHSINLDHFGGYMVVDAWSFSIVAGARYDQSLDDLVVYHPSYHLACGNWWYRGT